jgi:eukaryotic-like serine/threonine-protein kinase
MNASSLALTPDAYTGKKFGKYDVLCRLSTGGMSVIFLAFQRGLAGFKKLVVLKQILPDIKGEEEFVRMFLDEAKTTAAFTHPNIAHVYDLDISNGELFLAMEFVEGATLVELYEACRAAGQSIPMGLTLSAVRDTALALHYAHDFTDPAGRTQTIIHRDVAEKNIMVTYDGVIKLLDFGIAKKLGRANRTEVGMLKGTSGYMSPEQIRGETLDARSDVFSLGIVLHQCLTGVRLFYGKTPSQEIEAALKTTVHPPSRGNPSVPPELDEIVLHALRREREDRYATALEFARALDSTLGHLIWTPEKRSEFVLSHFTTRREKVRAFISEMQVGFEHTGEIPLRLFMQQVPVSAGKALTPAEMPRSGIDATGPIEDDAETKTVMQDLPPVLRATRTPGRPPSVLTQAIRGRGDDGPHEPTHQIAVSPVSSSQKFREEVAFDAPLKRGVHRGLLVGILASTTVLLVLLGMLFAQAQKLRPTGRLVIFTRPSAVVFYETQELGTTPLSGVRLPLGPQTLRLVGPDGQARLLTVELEPGRPTRVDVRLDSLKAE